eukprot:8520786-Prorocentrum_lima.AAC.1
MCECCPLTTLAIPLAWIGPVHRLRARAPWSAAAQAPPASALRHALCARGEISGVRLQPE